MFAFLCGVLWPAYGRTDTDPAERLQYGVYDPDERFADSNRLAVEHIFVHWQPHDVARIRGAHTRASSRNRWLMVTIEPWPAHGRAAETLFSDIVAGLYDPDIASVCSALGALGQGVFIRWAQEMEDPTGRYPWATGNAEGFVATYRYFVDHCRPWSHGRFFFVWSPKGLRQMADYFPGPSYVDYVGVSLYALERWDIAHFGKPRDFNAAFGEVYGFASQFKKPIMIAELGVQGSASYRDLWFSELARAKYSFPLLRIAVYFDAKEPWPWPDGFGNPDWRIDTSDWPIDPEKQ
ncbi:MAG TPA: glycosyl hydrolase [Roseiarcus sp.]